MRRIALAGLMSFILGASLTGGSVSAHGGNHPRLEQRVAELEAKTERLDSGGVYRGPIFRHQVRGVLCHNNNATWVQQDNNQVSILSC